MYNVVYEQSKAESTFPPLFLPGGVLVVWVCVRWLVTPVDFSLWSLEPWPDCCLAVLHGVPSESWGKTKQPQEVLLVKLQVQQLNEIIQYLKVVSVCVCVCSCRTDRIAGAGGGGRGRRRQRRRGGRGAQWRGWRGGVGGGFAVGNRW